MKSGRRLLKWLLGPLHRFVLRRLSVGDVWEPVTSFLVKPQVFGPGSTRKFAWYFEGTSTVTVRSIAEICQWLAQAQYVSDPELFNESDFWQHPGTFEHLRKGDCEDHALWAWRKLVDLGFKAHFFVGQWRGGGSTSGQHAWVVYEDGGRPYLLEPVIKDPMRVCRSLDEVRDDYRPHFSVDAAGKTQAHGGYVLSLQERELEPKGQAA